MNPTACMIVIGNEILSGRTQDSNINWIAKRLNALGIALREARVIPDIESTIIETVNECRRRFDYVFTSGGIGPTHDDITSAAIARAFGVPLSRNPKAEALLEAHYTHANLNAARLKMADIPEGAALITNPVSAAPGFRLDNVFVMAGVPAIMQAMFDGIAASLKGGAPTRSKTLSAYVTEGVIAEALTGIQHAHPDVEIGSYPFIRAGKLGVSLVARGQDAQALEAASEAIKALLIQAGGEVEEQAS